MFNAVTLPIRLFIIRSDRKKNICAIDIYSSNDK